jgi:hypothetical protein
MLKSETTLAVIGVVLIILIISGIILGESYSEVNVYVCEANDLTTYVSKFAPPKAGKFGSCRIEVMTNEAYRQFRYAIKHSR